MKDELDRQKFHEAIDRTLSGLQENPFLVQQVKARDQGKEKVMIKRKLPVGIIIAIVLFLLMATAVAAVVFSSQQFVEEVAVPNAVGNDSSFNVNGFYSAEQLSDMIKVLSENGITFEENSSIMQALQSGHGYYEEEFIMAVCVQAFGGPYYSWTLEQQDWFEGIMVEIGWYETHQVRMPGEGNMTYEEAEAFAFTALKAKFGEELEPENRSVYRLLRSFYIDEESGGRAKWSFTLDPLDLYHGRYSIEFFDDDPARTAFLWENALPDWTQPYTGDELMNAFRDVYSWNMAQWPQSIWHQFHEMMLTAQQDSTSVNDVQYRGYQLADYPMPGEVEKELSREEAVAVAKEALRNERAVMNSAVLTEYGGSREWLVGMMVYTDDEGADDPSDLYVIAVDSRSGEIISTRKQTLDDDESMPFVPQAAYEKAREGILTRNDYIRLAADALQKEYPELNLQDPDEYEAREMGGGNNSRTITFMPKNVKHGIAAATIRADGTVGNISADTTPLNGDNLFRRYWDVYGYYGDWDQSIWVQAGHDMRELEPVTADGIIMKKTVYPEEALVPVSREKAQEAAMIAAGKRNMEINTCVLVGAEPHPVWIMRVLTLDAMDPVIGIDAVTGECVFREVYKTDYTPHYVLYSMPETWRSVEMEMLGAQVLAVREVTYKFSNMALDEPEMDLLNGAWDVRQEGNTVIFTGKWAGMKNYEVELDEKGFVLRCEETDSAATEPRPAELPEGTTAGDFVQPLPPLANGKPWFFGKDFADADFWALFEEKMAEYDVNAYNIQAKTAEWNKQYGSMNRWPQDCIVLFTFMISTGEYDFEYTYPVFESEGKPGQAEIYTIAKDAFCSEYAAELALIGIGEVLPAGVLNNDGMDSRTGKMFGKPTWWVNMVVYDDAISDWRTFGYVQLDEDGNVLEVTYEPFSNG